MPERYKIGKTRITYMLSYICTDTRNVDGAVKSNVRKLFEFIFYLLQKDVSVLLIIYHLKKGKSDTWLSLFSCLLKKRKRGEKNEQHDSIY